MEDVELCRLCSGKSSGIEIFNNNNYLPYKIVFTLDIEVKETDQKKTLCNLCYIKVNDFTEFKNMCKNTQKQGIGTSIATIKIEPKEIQELPLVQIDANTVPIPMLPLPFLFRDPLIKTEEKCGSESSVESSVDSLINQVQTDDSMEGVPPPPPPPAPAPEVSPLVADTPASGKKRGHEDSPGNISNKRRKTRQNLHLSGQAKITTRQTRSTTGVLARKHLIDEYEDDDSDEPDVSDTVIKPESPIIKHKPYNELSEGTCVKCEKEFSSVLALETHQMEAHSHETWYCVDCFCGFPNLKTWRYHKRNICKKSTDIDTCENKAAIDDSKSTHPSSEKTSFKYSFCKIKMDNNSDFLEHLKVHKKGSVSLLKCNLCDITFKEKGALICHKEFHHKKELSNTNSSDKMTTAEIPLSAKIDKTRKYNKEYKCNTCEETFSTSGMLICHQVLAHKKK